LKNKGEIIIYKTPDNKFQVEVRVEQETVWLNQQQMAHLFNQTKQNISLHINNCFKEGELKKNSVVKESLTTASDGKAYRTKYYNLDVIISVGYRVKSIRGTQFRIWANRVLKDYLIKGYALNEKRLSEKEKYLSGLKSGIALLEKTVSNRATNLEEAIGLIKILSDFSRGLSVIDDYDNENLDKSGRTSRQALVISYDEFFSIVNHMKKEFTSPLFGKEKDQSFQSSCSQIYQSFGHEELYPTIEEKAANLLYLVVKNHSFIDGNKRIAAAVFLYFLNKNRLLYGKNGNTILSGEALASLTLMIAESIPDEKDIVIKIIVSILNRSVGNG
jgi:prophage maintenance system killer protein